MSALTNKHYVFEVHEKGNVPLDSSGPGNTTNMFSLPRLQPGKDLVHVLPVHFGLLHKRESDAMVELIINNPMSATIPLPYVEHKMCGGINDW